MSPLGLAIGLLFGIPLVLFTITAGLTVFFLQAAITIAIGGYLLGIPWAIWFRATKGRWPRY